MADSKKTKSEPPDRSIEDFQRELAETKTELAKQKRAASTAQKKLKKAQKDHQQLEARYKKLSSESVGAEEVELMVEENDRLSNELEDARASNEKLERQMEVMKQEMGSSMPEDAAAIDSLVQDNERLQREFVEMKSRMKEVEERLDSMKNEIQTLEEMPATPEEPVRSKTAEEDAQHPLPVQHIPVPNMPSVSETPTRPSPEITVQSLAQDKRMALIKSEFTFTQQGHPVEPEQAIEAKKPITLHTRVHSLDPTAGFNGNEEIPNYQIQVVVASASDQTVITRQGVVRDLTKGSSEYRDTIDFPGLDPGTYLFRVFAVSRFAHLNERTDVVLNVV